MRAADVALFTRLFFTRQGDRLVPLISRRFLEGVNDVRAGARYAMVAQGVAEGDVERILAVLGVNLALNRLAEGVRQAYVQAGEASAGVIQRARPRGFGPAVFRFDVRNPRAEEWLRTQAGERITGPVRGYISIEQRAAIQEILRGGVELGRNPNQIARDIVGRTSPITGRREGGVVGLNGPQAQAARSARAELSSNDPAQLKRYLLRVRRDRRFDGAVDRALDTGRPIRPGQIDRMVGRYEDRLLALRGEAIARTEALSALSSAADETIHQAIDAGIVREDAVEKVWSPTLDTATRDDHISMRGQRRPLDGPFEAPDGSLLMYPRDTSLGADASQIVNCRCAVEYDVDFIAQEAAA